MTENNTVDNADLKARLDAKARANESKRAAKAKAARGIADRVIPAADLGRTLGGRWAEEPDWLTGPHPRRRQALLALPGEERELFLPQGKTAMIAAAGGTGKTTLLVGLALSVATGKPWLGHYPVEGLGKVLLALGEEDAEEMHRALFWQAQNLGITDTAEARQLVYERVHALPLAGTRSAFIEPGAGVDQENGGLLPGHEYPDWTPAFVQLRQYLKEHGPWALIVLDPASRFMGPDAEVDNAAATRFIEMLELLSQAPGAPTVLIAHHTNKASLQAGRATQADARGSSALTDGIRWQASLKHVALADGVPNKGNRIVLEVTKTNYGPATPPLHMVRPDGEPTWRVMTSAEREAEEHAIKQAKIEADAERKVDKAATNKLAKAMQAEEDAAKVEDYF